MARRQNLALSVALAFALFFSITYLFSNAPPHSDDLGGLAPDDHSKPHVAVVPPKAEDPRDAAPFKLDLDSAAALFEGDSIAPKLENATLKYAILNFLRQVLTTSLTIP